MLSEHDYRKMRVCTEVEFFISQNDGRTIKSTKQETKYFICCYLGKKKCPLKYAWNETNIDACRLTAQLGSVDCEYVLSFVDSDNQSDEDITNKTRIVAHTPQTLKLRPYLDNVDAFPRIPGRKTSDKTDKVKTLIRDAVYYGCNNLKDILDWINDKDPDLKLSYKALHPIFTTISSEFDVKRGNDGLKITPIHYNALCSGKCDTCSTPCELYKKQK